MRLAVLALCAATVLPAAAQAADGRIDWPTFFRTGPGKRERVVAELFRGTVVDVRSCNSEWCQVQYGRTVGYVERSTLNANAFPASTAATGQPACFDSVRNGYGSGDTLRYCPR